MSNVRALVVVAVLSLAVPAGAAAKVHPYIPPGNSGANQYVESIPTAGGSDSTRSVTQSPATGSALAPATQSALRRAGPAGRATAEIANATAPARLRHRRDVSPTGPGGGASGPGSFGAGGASGSTAAGSPAGAVLKSLFGLQGQGGAVPAILVTAALVLGASRLWRRRTPQ